MCTKPTCLSYMRWICSDSALPEYTDRAVQILKVILQLQDTRQESPTYGLWPYYYEEPLDQMDSPDWNYADFIGKKLVLTLKHHGDRLSEALRQGLTEAIGCACQAIVNRDVGPGYTNIAVMGAFVTLVGGEVIGQESWCNTAGIGCSGYMITPCGWAPLSNSIAPAIRRLRLRSSTIFMRRPRTPSPSSYQSGCFTSHGKWWPNVTTRVRRNGQGRIAAPIRLFLIGAAQSTP